MRENAYALALELNSLTKRIDIMSEKLPQLKEEEVIVALTLSIENLSAKYDMIKDKLLACEV